MELLKCKKFQGKIIKKGFGTGLYYLDQLSDEIIWVSRCYINRYLKYKYNINQQQYYNICVYGDINFIPICPYCLKHKRKFWRLCSGYYTTCGSHGCISDLHSEVNSYTWDYLFQHMDEYYKKCKKLGLGSSSLKKFLYIHFKKWMNLGYESDTCNLYIAKSINDSLKFGITQDISVRAHRMNYKDYRIIYTSNRYTIGVIEYLIKLELNTKTEYLEFNIKNIIKLASAINNSIKFIESDQFNNFNFND